MFARTASVRHLRLSPELRAAYHEIRAGFTVSAAQLRDLTHHFKHELEDSLNKEDTAKIPLLPTWVTKYATGDETGDFLALDLGGTNLRVVAVHLLGEGEFRFQHLKYPLPDSIRCCSSDELWTFVTDCLEEFLHNRLDWAVKCGYNIPLGFTFSFPANQCRLNQGVLQRWTKGFDITGVEGKDVVPLLQNAISKRRLPVKVAALLNDTTGTLVASQYSDPETKLGVIFGTGINGAYYDRTDKAGNVTSDGHIPLIINTEYGAFDNAHEFLPRTKYDLEIDRMSPRKDQQAYEKLVGGYYLGEILRLVLVDLYERGLLFQGQDGRVLCGSPFIMDASFPARAEADDYCDLREIRALIQDTLCIDTTLVERQLIQELSLLIGTRAARLSACAIAAVSKHMRYKSGHCACDGSVFQKYPFFKERVEHALGDIFGWTSIHSKPLKLVPAQDGSGVGAAIVACLASST